VEKEEGNKLKKGYRNSKGLAAHGGRNKLVRAKRNCNCNWYSGCIKYAILAAAHTPPVALWGKQTFGKGAEQPAVAGATLVW